MDVLEVQDNLGVHAAAATSVAAAVADQAETCSHTVYRRPDVVAWGMRRGDQAHESCTLA
jgi:hypothetical protein